MGPHDVAVMIDTIREDDNNMFAPKPNHRSSEDDEGDSLQPPKRRAYRSLSYPGRSPVSPARIHTSNVPWTCDSCSYSNGDPLHNVCALCGTTSKTASPELPSGPFFSSSSKHERVPSSVRRNSASSTVSLPINHAGRSVFPTQELHAKKIVERERSVSSIDSSSSLSTVKTSNTTKEQFWRSRRPSQMSNTMMHDEEEPKTVNVATKPNKTTQYCSSSLYSIAHQSPPPDGESSGLDIISEEESGVRELSSFQVTPIHTFYNFNRDYNFDREKTPREKSATRRLARIDEILLKKRDSSFNNSSSIPEERQPSSDPEDTEVKSSSIGNGRYVPPSTLGGMLSYHQPSKVDNSENSQNDEHCRKSPRDSDISSPSNIPSLNSINRTRHDILMRRQSSQEQLRGDESILSIVDSSSATDPNRQKKLSFICRPPFGILLLIISLALILFFAGVIILAVGFRQKATILVPYESPVSPTTALRTTASPTTASPTTLSPTAALPEVLLPVVDELIISGNKTKEETDFDVKLAHDGRVVAVSGNGAVRVFKKFDKEWIQIGKDIPTKVSNSFIPTPIALSEKNGDTIAFPTKHAIIVHEYDTNNKEWQRKGQVLFTDTQIQVSSIALSANGSVMAVATHGSTPGSGLIQVFICLRGNKWFPYGNSTLLDYAKEDGFSIDLSDDGQILLVGSWRKAQSERQIPIYEDHRASVYKYSTDEGWQPHGPTLTLSGPNESTVSVSLDPTGEKFAACTLESCGVYVVNEQENTWNIAGMKVDGGKDVRLSGDGIFMIVNSPKKGAVLVYQFDSKSFYSQYGTVGNHTGQSISISGRTIAVVSPKNDFITSNAGVVRLYKIR